MRSDFQTAPKDQKQRMTLSEVHPMVDTADGDFAREYRTDEKRLKARFKRTQGPKNKKMSLAFQIDLTRLRTKWEYRPLGRLRGDKTKK